MYPNRFVTRIRERIFAVPPCAVPPFRFFRFLPHKLPFNGINVRSRKRFVPMSTIETATNIRVSHSRLVPCREACHFDGRGHVTLVAIDSESKHFSNMTRIINFPPPGDDMHVTVRARDNCCPNADDDADMYVYVYVYVFVFVYAYVCKYIVFTFERGAGLLKR